MRGERCYLLLGEAPTEEAAEKIAEVLAPCPYVYFLSAFGRMVVGVFFLGQDREWWLRAVAEDPEATMGLVRAALYVRGNPAFPAGMEPRVGPGNSDRSPCGASCPDCPRYQNPCPGCPGWRPSG